jgi:MFS family permease
VAETPPKSEPPAATPLPPGACEHLSELEPGVRAQVRRTMRLAIVEGSFTQVFLNWTTGSVLVGFMLHLGAAPAEIALVSAVPYLSQLASPVAAFMAAAMGRRRMLTVAMSLGSRLSWLLAASLPMWPIDDGVRPWLLVAIVLFASLFLAAGNTLWTAWMGDVVPERERGRVFGLRTGVSGMVGMAANIGVGAFLDAVAAPISFQLALVVAVVTGLLGVAILGLQLDPPSPLERVRWRDLITLPLRDVGFRRFLRFTLYWNFVVMLSGPFVIPYFLQELHLTFTQVALYSAVSATAALFTTYFWGRVADRRGHKPVLIVGTLLVGLFLPSGWILAGILGNLWWLWIAAMAEAAGWGAVRLATFNLALGSAPRANRAVFIAMVGVATGAAGFAGGAIAGPLLVFLQGYEWTVLGATWNGYHSLFLIAAITRSQGFWWLLSVPERTPVPVRARAQRGLRRRWVRGGRPDAGR